MIMSGEAMFPKTVTTRITEKKTLYRPNKFLDLMALEKRGMELT
jgi:hypothetical protein